MNTVIFNLKNKFKILSFFVFQFLCFLYSLPTWSEVKVAGMLLGKSIQSSSLATKPALVTKGKYYKKYRIEGTLSDRTYIGEIFTTSESDTVYKILISIDAKSRKDCFQYLHPLLKQAAAKLQHKEKIVDWGYLTGIKNRYGFANDYNRLERKKPTRENDLLVPTSLEDFVGHRMIMVCEKSFGDLYILDFGAMKKRLAEGLKNDRNLNLLLNGKFDTKTYDTLYKVPFGIPLGRPLYKDIKILNFAQGGDNQGRTFLIKNVPYPDNFFSHYQVYTTALTKTVGKVQGIRSFRSKKECQIVFQNILKSMVKRYGGEYMKGWKGEISLKKKILGIPNTTIEAICAPSRRIRTEFLTKILKKTPTNERFFGSLSFGIKRFPFHAEECVLTPERNERC